MRELDCLRTWTKYTHMNHVNGSIHCKFITLYPHRISNTCLSTWALAACQYIITVAANDLYVKSQFTLK